MKICVLHSTYEGTNSPFKGTDLTRDPAPFLGDGHEIEQHVLRRATATVQVLELSKRGFDVFINLCDGGWDEESAGIEVAQQLHNLGLAYTGADPKFYTPSREKTKLTCQYLGIQAPAYVLATTERHIGLAARALRFPLMVKHPDSYGSVGMTKDCRVEDADALSVVARRMIEAFGGALIEEFIVGREFTVLVAENVEDPMDPFAFQPLELHFGEGESFKHFDLKWGDRSGVHLAPVTDGDLNLRLKQVSKQIFVGLGGTGYGRCDLRMDHLGVLYVLEINANCGLFYAAPRVGSADRSLQSDSRGYAGFIEAILRAAQRRRQERDVPCEAVSVRQSEVGLAARRAIAVGEPVFVGEERAHVLVSRSRALRDWEEPMRTWFRRFSHPVTDEIYAMWSAEPDGWRSIRHSCDPNTWLDGLDLVARRPIPVGEEITVDYATFRNEIMPDFVCGCGASHCRRTIRGTDYLAPFVADYGRHISDYVRQKRSS